MSSLPLLLELADRQQYKKHPPQKFVNAMGLKGTSAYFQRMAWRLFKLKRETVGLLEVHEYIEKKKAEVQEQKIDYSKSLDDLPVGCINSHFLDSGSFTLWTLSQKYAEEHKCDKWAYYDTDEFYEYMNAYAEFIKKYACAIDLYANVDVIPNPKLTWRNQQYLEERGINPVPVVHYTTDLKWLKHYIERDYEIVALGGLVGSTSQDACRSWIDRAFDIVCSTPDRLPRIKVHGFGITTYELLLRYPWFSVDSTTWTKIGAFGGILIPHKRRGHFIFDEEPYLMKVSMDSPDRKSRGKHVLTLTAGEKAIVQEWLDVIGVPLGKFGNGGEVKEYGVVTRHTERRAANLHFFEKMRESLPDWPWAFRSKRVKGLGLV